MTATFGPDPVRDEVRRALETLDAGGKPHESVHADLKEEAGRRAKDGSILPGATTCAETSREGTAWPGCGALAGP